MPDRQAVLYISYDGMLEPLGQSQVLGYLEQLASDRRVHLISFEKPADWAQADKRRAVETRIAAAGIVWHPLRYHKRPSVPATLFDVAHGIARAAALVARHHIGLIHARSYVAALIGLQVKRLTGAKLLFDMRGLWPDERVDGNIWPKDGAVYRGVKRLERRLLAGADHIVTLTHASRDVIAGFDALAGKATPIDVIPTCADLDRFRPDPRVQKDGFVLGYVGSVGTWYRFDMVLECFRLILDRRPEARLLVINRGEGAIIAESLDRARIDPAKVEVAAADHHDMPRHIARMTVGAAVIKPVFSKIASAPTKLAEYLGCGVPCLGNVNVGDMEEILEGDRTGVALDAMTPEACEWGVDRLFALLEEPDLAERCRRVALARFSLDGGVADYRRIYTSLLA